MKSPADVVIRVRNVSKAYRIWASPSARLKSITLHCIKSMLPFLWEKCTAAQKGLYQDFYALKRADLEVRRGQAVGIVGRNGSGKSTLLQIISGTLTPSSGVVEVYGKVAALLELGSGFNPEFSGRDNVYLNGAVLGLTPEQVSARYDDIVKFAEIGDFISHPVKTYSSGMVVRLAFAVAAHIDAEILIIDEALSVGDARFQLKCARTIDRLLAKGTTLLFVSHDTSSIKRLCNQAVLLEGGAMLYEGKPNDVINLYSKLVSDGGSVGAIQSDLETLRKSTVTSAADDGGEPEGEPDEVRLPISSDTEQWSVTKARLLREDERRNEPVSSKEFAYGGELGCIHRIVLEDSGGQARTSFNTGEVVNVRLLVEARESFQDPIFAMTIKSASGVEVYGTNSLFGNQPAKPLLAGEWREIIFRLHLDLGSGHYFMSFGFTQFQGETLQVIHRRYDAVEVKVHPVDRTFGVANLRARISERAVVIEPSKS